MIAEATGTTGSTGTTGATTTFTPNSTIGVLSLDGAGNFTITEYSVNGAAGSTTSSGSGTYSVSNTCSLSLTFATPIPGATGAVQPPAGFAVLLGTTNTNGLITVQPTTGVILPGVVINQ
jgi:hypothetical protein